MKKNKKKDTTTFTATVFSKPEDGGGPIDF
jgi:hypothetical protein